MEAEQRGGFDRFNCYIGFQRRLIGSGPANDVAFLVNQIKRMSVRRCL